MNVNIKANSRTNEIIVQNLEDEVLIYDLRSNQALSLNETVSKVWQSLNGEKTVAEIAVEIDFPPEMVLFSLDELNKKSLLAEKVEIDLPKDKVSRRKILLQAATTSIALPLIVGIVAPTALQAQSQIVCPAFGLMLNPNSLINYNYQGICFAGCPTLCDAFSSECCSNMLVYSGTCTNNPGPPQTATCTCICQA